MTVGDALMVIAIVGLMILSRAARMLGLGIAAIFGGALWWVIDFGSDKPQTLFYNYEAHPAFKMAPGDSCPADRHIWNGWCIK